MKAMPNAYEAALEAFERLTKNNGAIYATQGFSFSRKDDEQEVRQALELAKDGGWKDISTAPKDGTHILVWNHDRQEPEVAWWINHGEKWRWYTYDNAYLDGWTEYWQPITPPTGGND